MNTLRFRLRVVSPGPARGEMTEKDQSTGKKTGRVNAAACPQRSEADMKSQEQRWRECQEELDEPYIGGYTWGEFSALSERARSIECQKVTQHVATFLGYFKTCTLPVCRRAKACRGFISDAQYRQGGYQTAFPPCNGHGAPRHAEMLQALQILEEAAMRRDGLAPEAEAEKYGG